MSNRRHDHEALTSWQFRLGSAVLGMFAGVAVGLALAVLLTVLTREDQYFSLVVLAASAIGFILGLLHHSLGFGLAEAVFNFVVGALAGASSQEVRPDLFAKRWVRGVFWCGVVVGVLLLSIRYAARHL